MWTVAFTKRASKLERQMPRIQREMLARLIKDIELQGPVRGDWPNYSKLSDGSHHCHLSHRWVACWRETERGISVEVYYAGSRKEAPY